MFKRYYTDKFREIFGSPPKPAEGLGNAAVRSALESAGLAIPTALFDYYSLAGRHWINENHNRLRPIEELEWVDDQLVFMEENQLVAFWGIRKENLIDSDPIVWQGVNGDSIEWYAENYRLSRFLMAMWKWTVTGEEEKADPP